jgi:5'(3')-deoxyribonucleotidase
MKKIKIAIDLDDTLVSTVELLVKEMFKDKSFSAFRGYHSIKDFSFEEEMALYKYIRATINKQKISEFKPIPGSISVISKLFKEYELYIITARNIDIEQHTKRWANHYFPNFFKKIFLNI